MWWWSGHIGKTVTLKVVRQSKSLNTIAVIELKPENDRVQIREIKREGLGV